jgi:hypothetical protein
VYRDESGSMINGFPIREYLTTSFNGDYILQGSECCFFHASGYRRPFLVGPFHRVIERE